MSGNSVDPSKGFLQVVAGGRKGFETLPQKNVLKEHGVPVDGVGGKGKRINIQVEMGEEPTSLSICHEVVVSSQQAVKVLIEGEQSAVERLVRIAEHCQLYLVR